MKKERIVLSFIATLTGLLLAGIAFYFYQTSKTISPLTTKTVNIKAPTPMPKPSIFIKLNKPTDEEVTNKKIITVSGNTASNATVAVLTPVDEKLLVPASNGDFSTTVSIDNGENNIEIIAISPNGQDLKVTRTVTFSIEEF